MQAIEATPTFFGSCSAGLFGFTSSAVVTAAWGSKENHDVKQRVGTKTIGAMDRSAVSLTGSKRSRNDRVFSFAHILCLASGWKATNVVVNSWQQWGLAC